jgi:hypothetical protein
MEIRMSQFQSCYTLFLIKQGIFYILILWIITPYGVVCGITLF